MLGRQGGLAHPLSTAFPTPAVLGRDVATSPCGLLPSDPVFVCREGVNIEVEVSIEAVPHPAREQSLRSVLSGQSLSEDSLGGTSDRCSAACVPAD